MARLLPNTQNMDNPPLTNPYKLKDAKQYVLALAWFIKNYEEGIRVAIEDVVKISEKLIPYLLISEDADLQQSVMKTLCKICEADDYNRQILKKYIEKYGEVTSSIHQTNLTTEIAKYPNLFDFLCLVSSTEQDNLTSYDNENEDEYD